MTTITLEDYEKLREANKFAFGNLLDIRTQKPLFTDKKNNKDYYLINGLTEHLYISYLEKNGKKNPNKMIIQITITKEFKAGTELFESTNAEFIEEIQKYKCRHRAILYIDKALQEGIVTEFWRKDGVEPKVDLVIDLSQEVVNVESKPMLERYIKMTPELDKYGNKLKEQN